LAFAGIWNVGTVLDSTAAVAPLFDINQRTKAGWTAGAGIESHLAGDLLPRFRTTDYVRDWLPIRREQCAKRVLRTSRWS
jgi:hypothetical protein